jgi:DNA-binding MarR family transcriptional regulator
MKISPRELDFLRLVEEANDHGMAYCMNPTTPRQQRQSRRIGTMIGHGLLEERAAPVQPETFFSDHSRAYILHLTDSGRECLAALRES